MAGRFAAVGNWRKRRVKNRAGKKVHGTTLHAEDGVDDDVLDGDYMQGPFLAYKYESEDEGEEVVTTKRIGMSAAYPDDIRQLSNRRSLWLFSVSNPIRQFVYYRCVKSKVFETVILMIILANCFILALNNPPEAAEYFFLAVFTSELIVKVIALGLYEGHDAYLASPWNRLDAFVVVTAYLIFVPGVGNMSAIRALRVLRALRTISFAPGLQRMVDALIVCVMGIASVMALTVSIVFVFAILGLQLFMGVLRQKCVSLPPTGVSDAVWQAWVSDESNYVLNDGAFSVCGNASTALGCPSVEDLVTGASEIADAAGSAYTFNGVACLNQGDNPNFGFSSFDNIGWAMVSMFQVITLDFWEDVYNNVIYATGAPAVVFFILGVFIGAFFVFNLVLAVVAVKYDMQESDPPTDADGNRKSLFSWWPTAPDKPRDNSNKVQRLVDSKSFGIFIMVVILANTVAMMCAHHGMSKQLEDDLFIANLVFTSIFACEMIAKMTADGFRGYFGTSWNVFDFFVVLASVIEVVLTLSGATSVGFLSVLRIFRLFRVLRLAQHWKTMGHLISTIGRSLGQVSSLCCLMLIIMYLFAVMGMQLFGEYYVPMKFPDGEVPRWNFTDFQHSFLLVFRILCGEWIEPMWDTMLASSEAAVLYYLVVIVVGNFILLNLFLALLLSAFDEEQAEEIAEDTTADADEGAMSSPPPAARLTNTEAGASDSVLSPRNAVSREAPDEDHTTSTWVLLRAKLNVFIESTVFQSAVFFVIIWSSIMLCFEDKNLRDDEALKDLLFKFDVFFIVFFAAEFLVKVTALGFRNYFNNGWNILDFVLVIIGVLAMVLSGTTKSLSALRTLRALRPLRTISRWEGMKLVVDALMAAIPAFLNVFLVSMIFWLLFGIAGVQFFGGMFYKCVDGDGEKYSATEIGDRTACCGSNDCSVRTDVTGAVFRWQNSNINFDNIGNAYLALLQVATFEGWMEVMDDSVDATGVNRQPRQEAQIEAYYFYVIFIIVGALFTLNLFVGVIIDNFTKLKRQLEREGKSQSMFLSADQLAILDSLRFFLRSGPTKAPPRPGNDLASFRNRCYDVAVSVRFEVYIMCLIVLNMIVLAMAHYNQTEQETQAQFWLNLIFTGIFVIEAVIKLIGLGKAYFKSYWNIFDFFITVASVVDVLLDLLSADGLPIDPTFLRVLRVLRLARLMRLVKHAAGVRKLLVTMVLSLASLGNIGVLLFIIVFVFAIIGMVQFRYVKHTGALNSVVNFETFGRSFLLLFRLTTGAGWNDITDALSIQPPYCNDTHWQGHELSNGDCGDPVAAELFMTIFISVAFLIVINMYIAIILENLEEEENTALATIQPADIDAFYVHWQQYDEDATQFIDKSQMVDFFATLPRPFTRLLKGQDEQVYLGKMEIPLYSGPDLKRRTTNATLRLRRVSTIQDMPTKAHCLDILIATLKANGLFLLKGAAQNEAVERAIETSFKKRFPIRRACEPVSNTAEWLQWTAAAKTIQTAYKRRTGDGDSNPILALVEDADVIF